MKTNHIVSFLAGLALLFSVGCATRTADVEFHQKTPARVENGRTKPTTTTQGQVTTIVGQDGVTYVAEIQGTTDYSDHSTAKEFDPLRSLAGLVKVYVTMGGGYGGGGCEPYYENSNYNVERGHYAQTQANYRGRGGQGGYRGNGPSYQPPRRPYVQNTGDGRLLQRHQEQPRPRPAYYDEYGNFHPEGYYYTNGNFYNTH